MKQLLLFLQHKLAKKIKEIFFMESVVCLPGIYESYKLILAKQYVLSFMKTYYEKIKNHLSINPLKTIHFHCKNQFFFSKEELFILRSFNIDNQYISANKAIGFTWFF